MPENKETIVLTPETEKKSGGMVDLQSERIAKIPLEVETWIRKIEDDPTITKNGGKQPKGDNDSILQPIASTVTKIILPTTKKVFINGFSKPTDNAWRWLTTFIFRIIKKSKGNVEFKEK